METQAYQNWLSKMRTEIELKRYRESTLECYLIFLAKFLKHFHEKDYPTKINIDEIKEYLLTLLNHPAQYCIS